MKFLSKLALMFSLTFIFCLEAEAQRGGGSPEEMASRQTQRMTDSLTLSTAQATKIKEINLKYAQLNSEVRKEARESDDFDRETMRANMKKMRAEQKAELRTILTSEQYTRFEAMDNRRKEQRRGKKGKKNRKKKKGGNKKSEEGGQ